MNEFRKPLTQKEKLTEKCDQMWSWVVKIKSGFICYYPGCKNGATQSHHIFPRSCKATRWDIDNGVASCTYHHHNTAHKHYELFRDIIVKKYGKEQFDRLMKKAYSKVTDESFVDNTFNHLLSEYDKGFKRLQDLLGGDNGNGMGKS
jgi:hypothetical protein